MKTLFVSGSDTDVGKTWVVAAIARELLERGESVQVIKPVQTGAENDVETDVSIIKRQISYPNLETHTLFSYALPIGPVAAARSEGKSLELAPILSRLRGLPEDKDWRIIEGAGSLATPVAEDGKDWADFAKAIGLRRIVLVVDNRVGGIGQSRLVHSFAASKGLEGVSFLMRAVNKTQYISWQPRKAYEKEASLCYACSASMKSGLLRGH